MARRLALALAVLLALCPLPAARAEDGPPRPRPPADAGTHAQPDAGHGWTVLVDERETAFGVTFVESLLLHFPPRTRGSIDAGLAGLPPAGAFGSRQLALPIEGRVERWAWPTAGGRVYLAMSPASAPRESESAPAPPSAWVRRVLSVQAEGFSTVLGRADGYAYGPGRPDVLASLDGDPDLIGLAAAPAGPGGLSGPVALLRERLRADDIRQPQVTLWVMLPSRWVQTAPPWRLERDDAPFPPTWRQINPASPPSGPTMGGDPSRRSAEAAGSGASAGAPPEWAAAGLLELLSWRDGFAIALIGADWSRVDVWIARPAPPSDTPLPGPLPVPNLAWEHRIYPLAPKGEVALRADRPSGGGESGPEGIQPTSLFFIAGQSPAEDALLALVPTRSPRVPGVVNPPPTAGLRVYTLRPGGPALLTTVEGLSEAAAARLRTIPLSAPPPSAVPGASGSLAIAWPDPPPTGPISTPAPNAPTQPSSGSPRSGAGLTLAVREISAATGRTLFDGGPAAVIPRGLGSSREYQALAVLLVITMAGVVVFVLRGDGGGLPELPDGVVPADPLRRAAAIILDYVPASVLVSLSLGLDPTAMLSPDFVFGREPNILPLVITLGVAGTLCTLCEWLFGRSLGKYILGLRVLALPPTAPVAPAPPVPAGVEYGRPAFWQAAVRNYLRWVAPVIAVFALFDEHRRHPADLAARTVVVMGAGEEEI